MHREVFESLGQAVVEIRGPSDLDGAGALVIPGGESTAISKLLDSGGLFEAIRNRLSLDSLPVFGTCAGMIMCAGEVIDGTPEQQTLEIFDAVVRRNGVGPQSQSFEAPLTVKEIDGDVQGVFIRSPIVEKVGESVEVLAEWNGRPVLCRQGHHLFATFHPELAGDDRIHRMFLDGVERVGHVGRVNDGPGNSRS